MELEQAAASEIVEKLLKLATDCLETATNIAVENDLAFDWPGPESSGWCCSFVDGMWVINQ